MSYSEYDDLFNNAQKIGQYQVFIFDIENSKKMGAKKRYEIQLKAIELLLSVYSRIEKLEKQLHCQILHQNSSFFHLSNMTDCHSRGDLMEPFNISGDCFGFTIIRDSLDSQTIYNIWKYEKSKIGLDCNFHCTDGYYETDEYAKGDSLYFRGYCIQKLQDVSKKKSRII